MMYVRVDRGTVPPYRCSRQRPRAARARVARRRFAGVKIGETRLAKAILACAVRCVILRYANTQHTKVSRCRLQFFRACGLCVAAPGRRGACCIFFSCGAL